MSDTPQGPQWWQATDGRWYPPEWHPHYSPPASAHYPLHAQQPPIYHQPVVYVHYPAHYPILPFQHLQQPLPQQPLDQPHTTQGQTAPIQSVHQPTHATPQPLTQTRPAPVQPATRQQSQPPAPATQRQPTGRAAQLQPVPQQPPYPALSPGQPDSSQPPKRRRRRWRRWATLTIVGLIAIGVIAALNRDDFSQRDDSARDETVAPAASTTPVPPSATPSTAPPTVAPQPSAAPTTEPVTIGSRENPVPLGQPATITLNALGDGDKSEWTITVDGPGTDITEAVLAENSFNEPPAAGHVFFGVPVTLTLDSAGKEPLSVAFNLSLDYFGATSLAVIDGSSSEGCGVTSNPFDEWKEVFVGGSITGLICYPVTEEDVAAGVLVTTDDIEGDRLFLATR